MLGFLGFCEQVVRWRGVVDPRGDTPSMVNGHAAPTADEPAGGDPSWPRSFLILHGVENHRPAEHWQYRLALQLRAHGEQVFYPQLPDVDRPTLSRWIHAVQAELAMTRGERIVVCHSLSCALWLHLTAAVGGRPPADRVLLVCPPGPSAFSWDAIAGFDPAALQLPSLKLSVATPRLVCSDDDPYCVEPAAEVYGEPLGCEVDLLPGAGHISLVEGYGHWPAVFEWCLDPATRLRAH
jgi:predicted alpha/beta hydrolase family esterase